MSDIQLLTINTLRLLAVDMIEKANSGHPGLPLGASPMGYTLFHHILKHNPKNPGWFNRDRFILSAGHGSAMLYALLYLYGYGLTDEDIRQFRQLNSKTPGHPEYGHTVGVEATTGPLGQGFAMAVGMAMAEKHLASRFNKEDLFLIDHYTYTLVGDGCLQEGITNEAASLAGSLGLNKLICLYDSNNITIEGDTAPVFSENVRQRFEALGWETYFVENGNDVAQIVVALEKAKKGDKPSLIEIKTKIGFGSVKEGSADAHGAPLGKDNIPSLREKLAWTGDEDFYVPEEVKNYVDQRVDEMALSEEQWNKIAAQYQEKYPEDYALYCQFVQNEIDPSQWDDAFYAFEKDDASRGYSGTVLNRVKDKVPQLIGGSADLAPSNKSRMKNEELFSKKNPSGRNLQFGIREHAMAAIVNGISLHGGLIPYAATFFVFSDYLKPALRLSALMKRQILYIFTHDSIGVGEDGPTHEPIEHLAMLRSTPDVTTIRPADGVETAAAYRYFLEHKDGPTCLVLSRQTLKRLEYSARDISRGAYVYHDFGENPKLILMSSGSEMEPTVEVAEKLYGEGTTVRVVSVPSMELFLKQDAAYRESVLPAEITKRVSIEALSTFGWASLTGLEGLNIGIDRFGASGKGEDLAEYFGITSASLYEKIKKYIQ